MHDSCSICAGELQDLFPFGDKPKVVRCRACGTESLRPLPTPEELKEHYRDYQLTKSSDEQTLFLASLSVETLRFYLGNTALANTPSGDVRFLDIGFGNGAGLFAGSVLGLQSYGLDLDSVCVANAVEFARKHALNVTCIEGTVAGLGEQPARFDLVKASQILEHVLDPLRFISEIAAVQPKGGYLIIECPNNRAAFWFFKNKLRRAFGRLDYYNSLKRMEHLWGYTKQSLKLLLEKSGYRVVFLSDYAMGDAIFEPQSVLWYPTLTQGLRHSIKARWWQPLGYAGVRQFDWLSSSLFGRGTGLAVLCQKSAE
jgi:2-polyprenyl-3-methyl-5-hydroxy-6-metoxy-1,4-benzoquinol methylase